MQVEIIVKQSISKILQFLEHKIYIKMDCHKLKFFFDIIFITSEKIFSKLHKLLPMYIQFYQEFIQNEIELAQITGKHKILDIGSGSIPASCILLAKGTSAKVTGIDKDLESVKRAKKIISRLNLEGQVEIIHANAMDFLMNDFDIIIIANGIYPYEDLLEHVAKNMRDDAIVVFRTYSHHNEELAPKDYFLKKFFIVGQKTFHKRSGSLVSLLLYKK